MGLQIENKPCGCKVSIRTHRMYCDKHRPYVHDPNGCKTSDCPCFQRGYEAAQESIADPNRPPAS